MQFRDRIWQVIINSLIICDYNQCNLIFHAIGRSKD